MNPSQPTIWRMIQKKYKGTLIGDYISYFPRKGQESGIEEKGIILRASGIAGDKQVTDRI